MESGVTDSSGGVSKTRIVGEAILVTGVVVLIAPVAVPAVAAGLGFTGSGIAAGSWAASFMASYGGAVGAGSTCAVLQSIGATGTFAGAGLTAASGVGISATGAALAGYGPSLAHGAGAFGNYAYCGLKSAGGAVGNVAVSGLKSLPRAVGSAGAIGGRAITGAAVGVGQIVGPSAGAVYDATRSLFSKY